MKRLLDLIAPRTCAGCGRRLGLHEEHICASCLLTLPRTHFADTPADNPMARLFWGTVNPERAAALCFYQPQTTLSHIIHQLKYYNQPAIGTFLGHIAAEEMLTAGFFDGVDALVPVPITRGRRRERGYNQSQLIALGMSEVTGLPVMDALVVRTHFVESQTRTSPFNRQTNVEGAFEIAINPSHSTLHPSPSSLHPSPSTLHDAHLLVVDDIVTTGATMKACCRVLQQAASVRISIFALGLTKG